MVHLLRTKEFAPDCVSQVFSPGQSPLTCTRASGLGCGKNDCLPSPRTLSTKAESTSLACPGTASGAWASMSARAGSGGRTHATRYSQTIVGERFHVDRSLKVSQNRSHFLATTSPDMCFALNALHFSLRAFGAKLVCVTLKEGWLHLAAIMALLLAAADNSTRRHNGRRHGRRVRRPSGGAS
jgi:hypothetical protein